MGSPITLSGFNSIDFNQILTAVMSQERQPLNALQTRQDTLKAQNSAFTTLASKLSALNTAADNLKATDSMAVLTATSSNAGVGISSTGGTIPGNYDVVVTDLALSQVTASTTTFLAPTDVVGTGGKLTLKLTGGSNVDINLTGSTTVQQLAEAINAEATSPAAASIVQTAPGQYQLVLTGKNTGLANAFTVDSSGITGSPTPLTFGANVQNALDASFTVNGLAVTSSSNTVSDVIPGATLSLTQKGVSATVKVSRDTSKAKELVNKFISAYNDVMKFTRDQGTLAASGDATSIARDPLLGSFRDSMRSVLMKTYPGGTNTQLAAIGIGYSLTGDMTLDATAFDRAFNASSSEVQTLFSGVGGSGGAFGAISDMLDGYTKSGGLLSGVKDRINQQVTNLNNQIDRMAAALEIRRQALQQEYTAADLAMTQLKNQSGSLGTIGSGMSF